MSASAPQTGRGERNLLIEASAGSGKTHHLVGRILRLLITFRQPDQIIALTFTRKAAGEFFDRILGALAGAAASDETAARTAADYQVPGLTREAAGQLLRLATDALHRLSLGTLDSFFSRVLRTFPTEFGIGGSFTVIPEAEESSIRRGVFDEVLSDLDQAEAFLEAFRQATFGTEEKRLLANLEDFVGRYHPLLLACPGREGWSRPEAIWPRPPWWLTASFDLDDIVARLLDGVPAAAAQHRSAGTGIEKLARDLPHFAHGATGRTFSTLHLRAMDALDDLHAGRLAAIDYQKKGGLRIDPDFQRALADAIGYLFQRDIVTRLQQTGGIHAIVRRYESLYHARVRRQGRLSFADILVLLSGAAPDEAGEAEPGTETGPVLSMLDDRPDAAQRRLRVDYRLDGQFHHWLIDEFQDTSRPQWRVLQNLIDEVIDDDSGERSFYYVGDEKQAIYGWRGGDSRLFQEVRRRYHQPSRPAERQIAEEHLDVSWRSGPVILDAVNAVFGNYQGLSELLGPDHAPVIRDRWEHTNAGRHEPSERTRNRPGFFQFVTVEPAAGEEEAPDEDGPGDGVQARWEVVREILNGIDPVPNRLSVAVLMRRTRQAAELADYLRQHGDIPVMLEGQTLIGSDHPLATSFRSLLHFAAHPGDGTAWEHLAMTPALLPLDHEALQRERSALPRRTLALLHDRGFAAVFRAWEERLAGARDEAFDAYTRRRADQIAEACRRFDLTGSRAIGDFLAHLAGYAVSDAPSAGVVQIMTIHKAKGLTFDAVILADLKPTAITALQDLPALKGYDDQRRLRWVLASPRQDIALRIEPLRRAYHEAAMDGALEELCNLYVALTRAKYANYVVAPPLPREPGSTAPHHLLARQFAAAGSEPRPGRIGSVPVTVRHQSGRPDWVAASAGERAGPGTGTGPEPEPAPDARGPVTARRRFPLRHRRIPSNAADKTTWGGVARLFTPESGSATGLGTAVHALFEQIGWIEDLDRRRFEAVLGTAPEFAAEALDQLERALALAEVRDRFSRSRHADPLLWIEKRFERITPEGEWVSGVFDRVTLERDPEGRFLAGHIVDFKTNRVASSAEIAAATEHYRSQMTVYRGALAALTGLDEAAIGAELIFTRPGVIRRVF